MRPVPAACLSLIHRFEGNHGSFEPVRAYDPAGNPEIGWGHKLSGPDDPLWFATLDATQADALALEDLGHYATLVCQILGDAANQLTSNQYAAVLDFVYNIGVGNFRGSSLCRFIEDGNLSAVPYQFGLWVHANVNGREVVLPGLVTRREAERVLWLTP